MSYTFDEIMEYHPGNREVYNEIKDNLSSLVPFVGAGLTTFAYGTWSGILKELTNKITNQSDIIRIKNLIEKDLYLEAAQ